MKHELNTYVHKWQSGIFSSKQEAYEEFKKHYDYPIDINNIKNKRGI